MKKIAVVLIFLLTVFMCACENDTPAVEKTVDFNIPAAFHGDWVYVDPTNSGVDHLKITASEIYENGLPLSKECDKIIAQAKDLVADYGVHDFDVTFYDSSPSDGIYTFVINMTCLSAGYNSTITASLLIKEGDLTMTMKAPNKYGEYETKNLTYTKVT